MQTIACLSQKGGVGKSTLCRLIAVSFALAKWKVKIADFNLKQKTSLNWVATRMEANLKPAVSAEGYANVKQAMTQASLFDLMVFDGRPESDTSSLEIARASDMIILPTGPALDDLEPQLLFANELRSKAIARAKIRFAIPISIDSAFALNDAKTYLESAGYQLLMPDLPRRVAYQIAQNSGRAIIETNFESLNARANELAAAISLELAVLTEEPVK